ncbi:MAG: tail fiber domain-containing protein [Bacteroidales bacterium]|nr:tail fiber domain-containing protein [Bacteroidales bacterium]
MKTINIIFLISLLLISNKMLSQLKIQSNGNVSIGTSTSTSNQLYVKGYNQGTFYSEGYYLATYGENIHARVNGSSSTYRNYTRCFVVDNNGSYKFYVYGDGTAYTKGVLVTSDSSQKRDITTIENALDKVMNLRGVSFNFNDNHEEINENYLKSSAVNMNSNLIHQIAKEAQRKDIGVIAQEVETVVPEVVRTMEDGTKAVAYHELIGLLIEAMKEQQTQINVLKNELDEQKILLTNSYSLKAYPNPTTSEAIINFKLPNQTRSASINIYNSEGFLVKTIKINAKENNELVLNTEQLSSGLYTYSLVADGKIIGTEKLIIVK